MEIPKGCGVNGRWFSDVDGLRVHDSNGSPGRGRQGRIRDIRGSHDIRFGKIKLGSESNELVSLSGADLKESHLPDVPNTSRGGVTGVPLARLNGSDRESSVDSMCGTVGRRRLEPGNHQ